jgi:pyridoxamine 5'-phosphate oxidase
MGLLEADVDGDALRQCRRWLDEADAAGLLQPRAMALATASPDGEPSVRMLLLRGFDERGFVFFTSRESQKGDELAANPRAALCFYWDRLERQLRAQGPVEPLSEVESAAYFATRPRGSRLAAWASPQSRVVPDRAWLDARFAETAERFPTDDVPLPAFWGGYRLRPDLVELWQNRPDRLHDRLRYRRSADGSWLLERLGP